MTDNLHSGMTCFPFQPDLTTGDAGTYLLDVSGDLNDNNIEDGPKVNSIQLLIIFNILYLYYLH